MKKEGRDKNTYCLQSIITKKNINNHTPARRLKDGGFGMLAEEYILTDILLSFAVLDGRIDLSKRI